MPETGIDSERVKAQSRVISRCICNLTLDEIARLTQSHGGDYVRALVELSIIQATRPISGMDEDALRTTSVRAVGAAMHLPYETCRRKVLELEKAGRCYRVSANRIAMTAGLLDNAAYRAECQARWRNLRGYLVELRAIKFDLEAYSKVSPQGTVWAPTRSQAVAALIDDYMLRLIDTRLVSYPGLIDTTLISAISIMNGESLRNDPDLSWQYAGSETPPPDSARAPVTIARVARRLKMNEDVVGRRMRTYLADGWLHRVPRGYLLSMAKQQTPEFLHAHNLTVQRFLQLMQALRQLGVDLATVTVD